MMGITSYCVILKMVLLDGGIKTIQIRVFPFSSKKKNEILFLFENPRFFQKDRWAGLKINGFFSNLRVIVLTVLKLANL